MLIFPHLLRNITEKSQLNLNCKLFQFVSRGNSVFCLWAQGGNYYSAPLQILEILEPDT